MINTIASIAAGGALGALLRYGVDISAIKYLGIGFPYGTLIVNVLGSFLMGVMIAYAAHIWQPPHILKLFIATGFLGAFTTFSTFSLDAVSLYERGAYLLSASYISASVILSIGALFTGMAIIKGITS